jgi:4-amino-4-deoxy-L-arabinose transferase-like glycosyltransferase
MPRANGERSAARQSTLSRRQRGLLWLGMLLLICASAFFLTGLISRGVFEWVPHVEDEAAYLFQAQVFAEGRLSVATPPYPESYWSPFVLDYQGRRFAKYPPGYPLLLSLGVRAGAPWAINALLGALSLWLIAHLGRDIYSPRTGLLAAALGLTCPVFLAESSTLLSHPTSLFFSILFVWAYARLLRDPAPTPQRRYALIAGLGLGYVLITRPFDAIGVGLPFAVYSLARVLRGDRALLRQGLVTAVVVLLCAVLLPLYWYRLTGALVNPYRLLWPYDRPGFGPEVGVEGHTLAAGLTYARYNLHAVATGLLGWPGYVNILFLFLAFVLRPRQRWNYLLLGSFASLVALHVSYWYYGGHDAGFPRYYYAALSMLLLLTARGIDLTAGAMSHLGQRLYGISGRQIPGIGLSLVRAPLYLVLVGLIMFNAYSYLPAHLNAFRGKSGITAAPLQVARQAGLHDAIVFIPGDKHWYDFAIYFSANSPTLDSEVVYAIYRTPQQASAVRKLYPDRHCYLQEETRLVPCAF